MEKNKEMKHTEENWTWSYGGKPLPSIGYNGTKICTMAAVGDNDGTFYPESEANAKRIVACVNALQGIDTDRIYTLPTLLDEGSKAIVEAELLKQKVEALQAERDELANAFQELKQETLSVLKKAHLDMLKVGVNYERPQEYRDIDNLIEKLSK